MIAVRQSQSKSCLFMTLPPNPPGSGGAAAAPSTSRAAPSSWSAAEIPLDSCKQFQPDTAEILARLDGAAWATGGFPACGKSWNWMDFSLIPYFTQHLLCAPCHQAVGWVGKDPAPPALHPHSPLSSTENQNVSKSAQQEVFTQPSPAELDICSWL